MSYKEGVELLRKSGASKVLLSLLDSGENSLTRSKLEEALGKLQEKNQIRTPAPPSQPVEKKTTPSGEEPEAIVLLRQKALMAYKEMSALHQKLILVKSQDERAEMAQRIVELDDENSECWAQIEKWKETGELPESEDPANWTLEALVKAAKNIPTNISYLKKQLREEEISDARRAKLSGLLLKHQTTLKEVKHAIQQR